MLFKSTSLSCKVYLIEKKGKNGGEVMRNGGKKAKRKKRKERKEEKEKRKEK